MVCFPGLTAPNHASVWQWYVRKVPTNVLPFDESILVKYTTASNVENPLGGGYA